MDGANPAGFFDNQLAFRKAGRFALRRHVAVIIHVAYRRKIFREVRDDPYLYNLTNRDEDRTCLTKAFILMLKLRAIGIESRWRSGRMRWDECLPAELANKAYKGTTHHHWLEVFIPEVGGWVTVDPTWDRHLAKSGKFRVVYWDGIHSTTIGAPVMETYSLERSREICERYLGAPPEWWAEFNLIHGNFLQEVNQWIDQHRVPESDCSQPKLTMRFVVPRQRLSAA